MISANGKKLNQCVSTQRFSFTQYIGDRDNLHLIKEIIENFLSAIFVTTRSNYLTGMKLYIYCENYAVFSSSKKISKEYTICYRDYVLFDNNKKEIHIVNEEYFNKNYKIVGNIYESI